MNLDDGVRHAPAMGKITFLLLSVLFLFLPFYEGGMTAFSIFIQHALLLLAGGVLLLSFRSRPDIPTNPVDRDHSLCSFFLDPVIPHVRCVSLCGASGGAPIFFPRNFVCSSQISPGGGSRKKEDTRRNDLPVMLPVIRFRSVPVFFLRNPAPLRMVSQHQ